MHRSTHLKNLKTGEKLEIYQKKYDVIIIGAGTAGVMAAITASKHDANVLLLERNDGALRKFSIAGSGKCNFTHDGKINDFFSKYGRNGNFLRHALNQLSNTDVINFFSEIGLPSFIDTHGKVFPQCEDGRMVASTLLNSVVALEVKYRSRVTEIMHKHNDFFVKTEQDMYVAKTVIVSTGGKTYPATGSTGDGYALAKLFGHKISAPHPALCGVEIANFALCRCEGISLKNIALTLTRQQKIICKNHGDLVFTAKGFSGPVILDIARYCSIGDELTIAFVEKKEVERLFGSLTVLLASNGKLTVRALLEKLSLPSYLAAEIAVASGIAYGEKCANLTRSQREVLENKIFNYKAQIAGTDPFDRAMVTAGGVDCLEIDSRTMQSKLVSGLFFAGEVLDIDGDCGGYNIQAAFSTGYVAGKNAALLAQKNTTII